MENLKHKITCVVNSIESLDLAKNLIELDRVVTQTLTTFPNSVKQTEVIKYRLRDYFEKIEICNNTDKSFDIEFSVRYGVASTWKYLIVSILRSIDAPNVQLFDQKNYMGISGLVYYQDLLSPNEQNRIIEQIDDRPWQDDDLKRRVQHYGYKYDYWARSIDHSMYVGPLPDFALKVARSLVCHKLIDEMPDQLIVNEYQPGQGISAHIDCESCFKNIIVTVSLGSAYQMDFINSKSQDKKSVLLEVGSALVLKDEARYQWLHQIKARKSDLGVPRGRRISLTFRNVIKNG